MEAAVVGNFYVYLLAQMHTDSHNQLFLYLWAITTEPHMEFCFFFFFEKHVPVCLCLLASVRVQMEQLVLEGEGLASSTVLLNASSQMERKITHRDAQAFLKSLVKDKWLSEVVKELFAQNVFYRKVVSVMFTLCLQSQGVYGAGPRFILELRPFLREIFGEEEIANCHICKKPVIRVSCCHDSIVLMHVSCARCSHVDCCSHLTTFVSLCL